MGRIDAGWVGRDADLYAEVRSVGDDGRVGIAVVDYYLEVEIVDTETHREAILFVHPELSDNYRWDSGKCWVDIMKNELPIADEKLKELVLEAVEEDSEEWLAEAVEKLVVASEAEGGASAG